MLTQYTHASDMRCARPAARQCVRMSTAAPTCAHPHPPRTLRARSVCAEDGELHISLQKMRKGETWHCVFVGHGTLDPLAETEVHKSMLLERFGQEHPGFDFSGAGVSGSVPDPRTFMGACCECEGRAHAV